MLEVKYEQNLKGGLQMVFPIPDLLPTIEDLLVDVHWLEGMILITDSQRPTFVSASQLEKVLTRLVMHPKGLEVKDLLIASVFEKNCSKPTKPVLILNTDGSYWLGLIGVNDSNNYFSSEVEHLNRCLQLKF